MSSQTRAAPEGVVVTPDHDETLAKLEIIVGDARSAFAARYAPSRWPHMVFDNDVWDYEEVGHGSQGRILFRTLRQRDSRPPQPLPLELAIALKAYFVLEEVHASVGETCVGGARHLWDYLQEQHGWSDFRWSKLRPPLLDRFADFMLAQRGETGDLLAYGTRAVRETELNAFLKWLGDDMGVISAQCVAPRSAHQKAFSGRRRATGDERRDRLPDRRALEALAELYVRVKEPWDRLMLALCGILLITGLRESEVRDLPLDCLEVEGGPDGSERVRFRYWNRKPAGSTYYYAQRWLSPMAASLAKQLVADIAELTRPARAVAVARESGSNADRLTVTPADRTMLTVEETAATLGFTGRTSLNATLSEYRRDRRDHAYATLTSHAWEGPRPPVAPGSRGPRRGYRLLDVAHIVNARQSKLPLIAYSAPDGTKQMLSETLFCVPDDPRHLASPVAVRKLSRDHIATFLRGPSSAFVRHYSDAERSALSMRPHGFRHWLNTLANKSGMSVFLITVWMQRRNNDHTRAYLWEAPDLADITRQDIAADRLVGATVDEAMQLPSDARQHFLENRLVVAHVGPGGLLCTKDMVSEDCGRQQACPGCAHALAEKGNVSQSSHLRNLASEAQGMVAWYRELESRGVPVVSRAYQVADETRDAAVALVAKMGMQHGC